MKKIMVCIVGIFCGLGLAALLLPFFNQTQNQPSPPAIIAPSLPGIPAEIHYRRSKLGNGFIFQIVDVGNQELFCTVTVKNTSVYKQYRLDIQPGNFKEIGIDQGWEAFPGDECKVEAANFQPISGAIPN
jgi:hypothetical protein